MNKLSVLILTLCILAVQTLPSFAWGGRPPIPSNDDEQSRESRRKPHRKGPDIVKELQLTEEQKVKAKELREAGRKEIEPIKNKIKELKETIHEMRASGASMNEMQPYFEEIKPLKEQAKELIQNNMQQFEAILTEEQKQKFQELKAKRKQEMAQKKHHHGFDQQGRNRGSEDGNRMEPPPPPPPHEFDDEDED